MAKVNWLKNWNNVQNGDLILVNTGVRKPCLTQMVNGKVSVYDTDYTAEELDMRGWTYRQAVVE